MDAKKIKIVHELDKLNITNVSSFVLSNPLKLSPELLTWAANYLHFRYKIKSKIPVWNEIKTLEPPPALSIEQSSSQLTAEHKTELISGKSCLDLTGGMGIDTYFFAQQFEKVTYVEQNADLCQIAAHNFKELGCKNIEVINQNAEAFLHSTENSYDLIYLDPARRDQRGNKVFFIEDCSPDVSAMLPDLFRKTENILVKYAPMLDIKAAVSALKSIYKVIVVAAENDVKEVLYWIRKSEKKPIIEAINLSNERLATTFQADFFEERETNVEFGSPGKFLYEPNAAILKAGLFKVPAKRFDLRKLAPNTHLYTNEELNNTFPGRQFQINKVEKYSKKKIKKELTGTYANVSCRNFPLKPEALKKLLNYKDGGENYIFFTQNQFHEKIVIFTTKTGDFNQASESNLQN